HRCKPFDGARFRGVLDMDAARAVTRFTAMRGGRTPWILRFPVGGPMNLFPLSVMTADAGVLADVGGRLLRRWLRGGFLGRCWLRGGLCGEAQGQTNWQEHKGRKNVLHTRLHAAAMGAPGDARRFGAPRARGMLVMTQRQGGVGMKLIMAMAAAAAVT